MIKPIHAYLTVRAGGQYTYIDDIIISDTFLQLFRLDFGSLTFSDTYDLEDQTVENMIKWINSEMKNHFNCGNIKTKGYVIAANEAIVKVLPFLRKYKNKKLIAEVCDWR